MAESERSLICRLQAPSASALGSGTLSTAFYLCYVCVSESSARRVHCTKQITLLCASALALAPRRFARIAQYMQRKL